MEWVLLLHACEIAEGPKPLATAPHSRERNSKHVLNNAWFVLDQ